MQSKLIWVNLAVKDVARTAAFYNHLGIPRNGEPTAELASFRFADNGLIIHFFVQSKLADIIGETGGGTEALFSLAATSKDDIDLWLQRAEAAGGSILRQAGRDQAGYYYGAFADPDGHKFNILLMEDGM